LAELLIQFHLRHLKEMDEVRQSVEELNMKLHPRNSPPVFNNGHSNGRQNGYNRAGPQNRGPPRRGNPIGQTNGSGSSFDQNRRQPRKDSSSNNWRDAAEPQNVEPEASAKPVVEVPTPEASAGAQARRPQKHNRRRTKAEDQ